MNLKFIRHTLILFVSVSSFFTNAWAGELLYGPSSDGANVKISEGSFIVYREATENTKKIPLIIVNGSVAAALLPGEFSQVKVCTNSINLRVVSRGTSINKGTLQAIQIPKNEIRYVKIIQNEEDVFIASIIDESQGKKALENIKRSSNIVNRYVPKITIASDTLFPFDSSELIESSYEILNKLVDDISNCPNQVNNLKIIGHTDRLGSEIYNQELSLKRAQSVADYLFEKGVKIPLIVEGRASKKPISTNCKDEEYSKLIQCLQVDRRVEIEY
jgi:outer membrane protein OmpA-like peptidoglycan-associated protein